ncbi:4Fe-4S dicluster domain-containing protein [Thalassococcus halodurans]|uniref:4Fe-4S dicluster domain-containing protein n=1 Tax=Thalassococcus halodurans TaxID=373675 RepID=A0A1H6A9K1_9RHOB|nr:4Fe-4S binding protein [Thalassococcus halodurans]SEG45042.1 4Fe-4S dicluster domain-containing protein [Thalassococcus halodurans]
MSKRILLCDCMATQNVDLDAIKDGTELSAGRIYTNLCQQEAERAAQEIAKGDVIIACGQERAFFEMLSEELDAEPPQCIDIRDRAGWSDEGKRAGPKQAALIADALLDVPAERTVDVASEGTCLIIGTGEVAFAAAQSLCEDLAITVLQLDDTDAPSDRRFDIVRGKLARATGSLGAFETRIDSFQSLLPGGRGAFSFSAPKNGAKAECDLILDLSGGNPLFPAHEKRDGYLRADPRNPVAVAEASAQAMRMVGTFEKPLYVRLEPSMCAHSRAEKVACSNCLNACPTGALTPNGDHIAIDPMICAGCGACSALCPSGAITYDAPPVSALFRRIDTLVRAYRKAGGSAPRLLVHDEDFGKEMIELAARHGRGVPADVIPMSVSALAGFGHAEMLAALGAGFAGVTVLLAPKSDRETLENQVALAKALAGGKPVDLIDPTDPDALSDVLYVETGPAVATPALPMGTRRQVTRVAAKALSPEGGVLDLPEGAPYGAVLVDTDACTLCLSCVSLCPSGALGDNPDKPQLLFQEDACLQCGLCSNICPEKAITLQPRMNLEDNALSQQVLNEEEPFACIECGSLFGVKSTIERISEKLAGTNAMFNNPDALKMIQMCDDCRVRAQFHSNNNPFQMGEPRRPRTTDDYLNNGPSKRRDH